MIKSIYAKSYIKQILEATSHKTAPTAHPN